MSARSTLVATLPLLVLAAHSLPIVDPGLFVIMGVSTCGNGSGYCLLGLDCTLDDDFVADTSGGHCRGLLTAFTPSAHFVCCRYTMDPAVEDADSADDGNATDVTDQTEASATVSITTLSPHITPDVMSEVAKGNRSSTVATSSKIEENLIAANNKANIPGINFFVEPETRRDQEQRIQNPDTFSADQGSRINEFVEYFNTFLEKNTYQYDPVDEYTQEMTTVDHKPFVSEKHTNVAHPYFEISSRPDYVDHNKNNNEQPAPRPMVHPCWMVFLQDIRSSNIICAGAVIANNVVLTTATCATRLLATGISYVGLIGINKQIRSVSIHEDFITSRNQQLKNNIGLLKLSTGKAQMKECILPISDLRTDVNSSICGTFLTSYNYGAVHTEMCSRVVEIERGINHTFHVKCERSPDGDEQVLAGSPLICEGILSGIAVHSEGEDVHFVAVTPYAMWILQNT
ncbi:uncharacterized protein LOC126484745 [Schistocerca serialis cubense]|uniref:uncharacterized protein LOC126484745 n=1 Tax=Schistocerca serialis cubense TaxID=2023355 RepID=UPI00214F5109|nr:uncharacterized protein LOC126484745 [Schistocerca serialis cubense]